MKFTFYKLFFKILVNTGAVDVNRIHDLLIKNYQTAGFRQFDIILISFNALLFQLYQPYNAL